jgi:hypothetical protein
MTLLGLSALMGFWHDTGGIVLKAFIIFISAQGIFGCVYFCLEFEKPSATAHQAKSQNLKKSPIYSARRALQNEYHIMGGFGRLTHGRLANVLGLQS